MLLVADGWASVLCKRKEGDLIGGVDGGGLTEYIPICRPEDVLPVVLLPSSWLCVALTP